MPRDRPPDAWQGTGSGGPPPWDDWDDRDDRDEDPWGDPWDEVYPDDVWDPGDDLDLVESLLEMAVGLTVRSGSPDHAHRFARSVADLDSPSACRYRGGETVLGAALGAITRWLMAAQRRVPDASVVHGAVAWVREAIGEREADAVALVAGVLGAPPGPAPAAPAGQPTCGTWEVVAALVWLVAGVVARFGRGDVEWLRNATAHLDRDGGPTL